MNRRVIDRTRTRPDPDLSNPPLTELQLNFLDKTVPEAYKIALSNRLTWSELETYLTNTPMVIFAYGSLQLPHELALCLNEDKAYRDDEDVGYALRMTPGKLTHHRVYAIRDRIFPGVLDDGTEDDVVDGMVIFGLVEAERQRLDRREGGWYSREERQIAIRMASGDEENIEANVYIWAAGSENLISPNEKKWSLHGFIKDRKGEMPLEAQPAPDKTDDGGDQRAYQDWIRETGKNPPTDKRYAMLSLPPHRSDHDQRLKEYKRKSLAIQKEKQRFLEAEDSSTGPEPSSSSSSSPAPVAADPKSETVSTDPHGEDPAGRTTTMTTTAREEQISKLTERLEELQGWIDEGI
jgi:cation transport regulator ChaC